MKIYRYSSYYKNTRSFKDLTKEEQERNIGLFYTDLINFFEGSDEVLTIDDAQIVSIQTNLNEKECDDLVAKVALGLELLPKKHRFR
ncbi:hypothetical protein ACIOWB_10330 [Pseudomonas capeferrum]|uniref:hypothetical protein n=1 Tax=Pseudomonas capeferrum TaxID=1495066 RepID=UPI003812F938